MSYLDAAHHASLIANPKSIEGLYSSLRNAFARDISRAGAMSDALEAAAFCSMVAWDLKPYGPSPPSLRLADLLAAPTIACSGYVAAAWQLMMLIPSCAKTRVVAVGWEGGPYGPSPVGNHAQMFATDGADWLFLDPTIGFVLPNMNYDRVAGGIQADSRYAVSFYGRFGGSPDVAALAREVEVALYHGFYRPSHALYYTERLDFFENLPPEPTWPTPAAAKYQR